RHGHGAGHVETRRIVLVRNQSQRSPDADARRDDALRHRARGRLRAGANGRSNRSGDRAAAGVRRRASMISLAGVLLLGAALAPGGTLPSETRVLDVDNARETVDADGRILGLARIRARPTRLEALLLLAAHAHPIALVAVEAGKLAVRERERVAIEYRPGVEMTLRLLQPFRLGVAASPPVRPAISCAGEHRGPASDMPTAI